MSSPKPESATPGDGVPPNMTTMEDAVSSARSSSDTTQDRLTMEPGDLEKVMSKHEDADVAVTIQESNDPNVVNWDGPDDPEKPLNWPASKKWINIALLSSITFLTCVSCFREDGRLVLTLVLDLLRRPLLPPVFPW